ncbi:Two-component system sensor kinase [Propionibacterium freudenreichii]|nr:Two-component system sensor kinase [Propionibacterium freudenreichii]CEI49067.1 Two-component system sensor kinase [Propionibacterium freudenreichii]
MGSTRQRGTSSEPPRTGMNAPGGAVPSWPDGASGHPAGRGPRWPAGLARRLRGSWLGGVCTGIADYLGSPVWPVRLCFVLLAMTAYLGVVAYAALWAFLPIKDEAAEQARAVRPARKPRSSRRQDLEVWLSIGLVLLLCLGLLVLSRLFGLGSIHAFFWPVVLAAVGIGLVWRQADQPEEEPDRLVPRWMAPLVSSSKWATVLRMGLGMTLVGASVLLVAYTQVDGPYLPAVLGMVALALAGFGVLTAPWMNRMRSNLARAHEEKLVADARADMAAHLHDSVLQTLALIQRQADDPKAVASLARRQERELREWLYGETPGPRDFRAALRDAGAQVEDSSGVRVEVICVGDATLNDGLSAMILAAREAMMNSAKHSGADHIDVYAEVDDDHVELFVRDRGVGFDAEQIRADRMGVRRSIIERMERHGGTAQVRSAPGEGTEVKLEIAR